MIHFLPTSCLWCGKTKNILPDWQLCKKCHNEIFVKNYTQFSLLPLRCSSFGVFFLFSGELRELILKWKYKGSTEMTRPLSTAAITTWGVGVLNLDYIVPIPPHISRLRERKTHQTLLLAKEISRWSGVPILHTIKRTRPTPSQTEMNREERGKNVKNSFSIDNGKILSGKKLLVIDDIITTGATIRAALTVLRRSNPAAIHVRALARQGLSLT